MKLARLFGSLFLVSCFATAASAAHVDMFLEIEGIDGESLVSTLEITGPGEAPKIALLVPAVQKVREAAARSRALAQLACGGTHIPKATLTMRKAGGATAREDGVVVLTIELRDVMVTRWGTSGGVFVAAGDVDGDGMPQHEVEMTYGRATYIWPDSRLPYALDCSSGICACAP